MELKFKDRIKDLRNENGLSQRAFAELLGTNHSKIAKWETGQLEPNLTMLMKIAVEFKTSVDYLLGLVDF